MADILPHIERDNSAKGEYDIIMMPPDECDENENPTQCQSTNNSIPNKKCSGLKDKSKKSVKYYISNNSKVDKQIMTNGLACASTTVPILTSVNVPNPNIIESNELKTPILLKRETAGRRIESKKGNRVNPERTYMNITEN